MVILCFSILKFSVQGQITFHDYSANTITGDSVSLSQFKGKKLLVVNTASYCGYTPQFQQLESLYNQYKTHNFEIIGFPCNDFGGQDPYDDSTIYDFCQKNYGVTFQMMSKVSIVKGDTVAVYKWLQNAKLNGVKTVHVNWNFNKFLIDENGHWVKYFSSTTLPTDTAIINWILKPTSISLNENLSGNNLIALKSVNSNASSIELLVNGQSASAIFIGLYAIEGRIIGTIYNGKINGSEIISYPVSSLPNGIYIIKAEGAGTNQTIKFAIQR